jgi:uncharacterized protein (DUF488 family)
MFGTPVKTMDLSHAPLDDDASARARVARQLLARVAHVWSPVAVLNTIGYQAATVRSFLEALREGGVELLVDVRAVASSRRPGFAKSRLAANLGDAGVGYVHLRGLGTPADGRAAARAGRFAELRDVYLEHLATPGAQAELAELIGLVQSGRRVCLLCFEADPAHCHRSMVADAIRSQVPVEVAHLFPTDE